MLSTRLQDWLGRCAAWLVPAMGLPTDYPNRLAAAAPYRPVLPTASRALVLLVVLCLVPRVAMALRITHLCTDAVLYIHLAEALERGDFAQAFTIQLNVYPLILVSLHKLGLDWELAGKLWGVTASTLVVLPLFAWVRRQFDDRVAAVACVLYAIHPKLIEWSPEMVRDSTFWLFFTLALNWLWRAVTEVRWRYQALAGLAMALASLTRFEGVFLLVPLVGWNWARFRSLNSHRWRLAGGAALCVLGLPAILLVAKLAWSDGAAHWNPRQLGPVERAERWLGQRLPGLIPGQTAHASAPPSTVGPVATSNSALTTWQALWAFVHTMERGLTPIYGVLLFGGYLVWRRVFDRSDHVPLTLVFAGVAAGVWIHLDSTQQASSRYALSIVIMSARCAALGMLTFLQWLVRMASAQMFEFPGRRTVPAACLLGIATFCGIDALSGNVVATRSQSAQLGEWLHDRVGPHPVIVGQDEHLALIGYYAQGATCPVPVGSDAKALTQLIAEQRPDVLVFSACDTPPALLAALDAATPRHMAPFAVAEIPGPPGKWRVVRVASERATPQR